MEFAWHGKSERSWANNRDSSFEYYMSEPVIVNDAKGIGFYAGLQWNGNAVIAKPG